MTQAGLPALNALARTEAEAMIDRVERRFGVKVRTSFDCPPIPTRAFDWSAVTDDYDADCDLDGFFSTHPIGRGATEAEAIADLGEQLDEKEDARC